MTAKTSLKEVERKLFQTSVQDGILDIQIGCVLLIFAVAPLLGVYLGDFWSSFVFLPFWIMILLGGRSLRKNYIQPRIGQIEYGSYRVRRLKNLNLALLIFNLAALGGGLVVFFRFQDFQGWLPPLMLSILCLIGFSLAGYLVDSPRFFLYGILVALAPLVGEFLYRNYRFTHHGFPVTFGAISGGLILAGSVMLIRLFRKYPVPDAEDLEW